VADTSDYARGSVERQLARLDGHLRRHVLVQCHAVTDDRRRAAEEAAGVMDVSPEIVLDSPYVLVGTAAEIAAQLHADQAQLGIERWTIFADRPGHQPAEAFVPVLDLLAGR
jgi:alkanesulfonate monooxygenase SsuD/methylene tetrahydromethanopterin reductase-like flavin-dependent oxidoreductase (luciferase family)